VWQNVDTRRMEAAWEPTSPARGPARLLEDCAALERFDEARPSARDRLQHVLGHELAGLLLRALAGNHRRRSRGLVT
jgi:hypothetical protein